MGEGGFFWMRRLIHVSPRLNPELQRPEAFAAK
jgi:hypothetical protein